MFVHHCCHSQAQSKHGWWLSDLDIKCYSSWHSKFALAFGLPCLLLLCLGIPLVAAALPIRAWKRNQLQEDQHRAVYGFLHWRYRCGTVTAAAPRTCMTCSSTVTAAAAHVCMPCNRTVTAAAAHVCWHAGVNHFHSVAAQGSKISQQVSHVS